MTDIGEKIIRIVRESCALEEAVTEDSRLGELSLDSLSFISALVQIEDETEIEFEIEELNIDGWETVGNLIKVVEEKGRGKQ